MAAELNVATHVLRFWESKFPILQPMKAAGGRRFYHAEAAAIARYIRDLLYVQKLTISGAQAALGKQKPKSVIASNALNTGHLAHEVGQIIATLEGRA